MVIINKLSETQSFLDSFPSIFFHTTGIFFIYQFFSPVIYYGGWDTSHDK